MNSLLMRGLLGATGVIHHCGESKLIYLYSHSNIVWCTWIPLQNYFPCSSLVDITVTPEIHTSSVLPEETGVLEREREIFYLLCAYVIGIAATPAMCISSEKFLMREMESVLLNHAVNCKDYKVSVGRGIK